VGQQGSSMPIPQGATVGAPTQDKSLSDYMNPGGEKQGWTGKSWDWLNTGLISPQSMKEVIANVMTGKFGPISGGMNPMAAENMQSAADEAQTKHLGDVAHGRSGPSFYPSKAALMQGAAALPESAGKVMSGFTSPLTAILAALSGGTSMLPEGASAARTALSIPQTLAGGAFAVQGGQQAFSPAQQGETSDDTLQRRLMGGAQMLGGIAGAHASVGDALKATIPSGEGLRTTAQKYFNIGPELTRDAVTAREGQVADITAGNKENLLKARSEHEAKVGDIERENQAKEEAAQQKYSQKVQTVQEANRQAKESVAQRQQLTQEAGGHAKELSQHLTDLYKTETEKGKAMFPDVQGSVDSTELVAAMKGAKDKLQGTTKAPPVLERIIGSFEKEQTQTNGPMVAGRRFDLSNPNDLTAYRKYKESGAFTPEEVARAEGTGVSKPVDYAQLRGFSSELGDAISNANLANDERASLVEARNKIDGMTRTLAEKEGKLGQFEEARQNWKQLERTFNRTWSDRSGVASPIARALQMKDPVSGEILPQRVMDFLAKDQNYSLAQKMLGRYKGRTDLLQVMKEKLDQAGKLPSKYAEKPLPTQEVASKKPFPTSQAISLKEMPPDVDPQALKAEALGKTSQGLRSMTGIRGALDLLAILHTITTGNPISMAYPLGRRGLSYGLETSAAKRFLTKPTAADAAALKSKNVFPSKAAAKAAEKP